MYNLHKIHTIIYIITKCIHSYLGAGVARVYNRCKVRGEKNKKQKKLKMYQLHRPAYFINHRLWSQREVSSTWVLLSTSFVIMSSSYWVLSHNSAIWKREIIILTLTGVFGELNIVSYANHLVHSRCFINISPCPSRMRRDKRTNNLLSSLKNPGVHLSFKSNDLPGQVYSCCPALYERSSGSSICIMLALFTHFRLNQGMW